MSHKGNRLRELVTGNGTPKLRAELRQQERRRVKRILRQRRQSA